MPDIRLIQDNLFPGSVGSPHAVQIDWLLLNDGTLDQTQALATGVIVALGTDRLASRQDILPDPDSIDRAGWWGDLDAEEIWQGWPIGCRLWLLKRDKIVGSETPQGATVTRVEHYIREAIQPFLDLKIASHMEVEAERVSDQQINARIRLFRGPALAVDLRYQVLWVGIIESSDYYDIGRPIGREM